MSFNHLEYFQLVKTIEVLKRISQEHFNELAASRALREEFLNLKPQGKIAPKFEDQQNGAI